jgi:hypothetical protein
MSATVRCIAASAVAVCIRLNNTNSPQNHLMTQHVWSVLQRARADFQARCSATQRLHQAHRGVHSCVQAAAAARVAGGDDILDFAENGDSASVLCHVTADAHFVKAN